MKRCKNCGHTNGRLRQGKSRYSGDVLPGQFECVSPIACIRRMELVGQWVGKRVLRRIESDGSEWTIRRHDGTGLSSSGPWWVLTFAYRDHRMSSMHSSPDAAKAHADDLLASWRSNSLSDYRERSRA